MNTTQTTQRKLALKNITVLSGKNTYAVREKLKEIKQEFISTHGMSGIEVLLGEQIEPDQLGGLIGGMTLFASHRLIILKQLSENKPTAEKFLEFFKNIPEEVRIVLIEDNLDKRTAFYKTLKKETDFHEFLELDELAASKWVYEFVQNENGNITSADARLLVRYVGIDQLQLSHEIAKLLAYDQNISKKTIEQLVEKSSEETIFQLLEYALSTKKSQAITVLEGLEQAHEDPFQVANMLIWQTHILTIVVSALDVSDGEIAKQAKINPFVVKKTRSLAKRLSRQQLNKIINAVAELDVKLKTTSADPWRVLEVAIHNL